MKIKHENQGAPRAREGKRPALRIVPMFDANSDRGALILSETWNGADVSLED